MHVLAVAETDSFLKWAAWTLRSAPPAWVTELVTVRSRLAPDDEQVAVAVDGTGVAADVPRLSPGVVRRRIASGEHDLVLLACTGPTVAALTVATAASRRRPVIASGLPGVGLPARPRAARARRMTDLFIAHSRREVARWTGALAAADAPTRVALSSLPFLAAARRRDGAGGRRRIVFATQTSVPADRAERRTLLERLSALGPPVPLVKLRSPGGGGTPHAERFDYRDLWAECVAAGRAPRDGLEFRGGSMAQALDEASCLVTISSTAALEAIHREVPVLVVSDFGVRDDLLNAVFDGSGLLRPLTAEGLAAVTPPAADWLAENYFHDPAADDWVGVAEEIVAARRRGTRPARTGTLDPRLLGAAARGARTLVRRR